MFISLTMLLLLLFGAYLLGVVTPLLLLIKLLGGRTRVYTNVPKRV